MALYLGDDWSEDHHDVHLMNDAGERLAARRLPEGVEGITALHALVAEHASGPGEVILGIETDRGPWVGALLAAGYRVYAINPRSASRYRDRHHVGGAKSDAGDARLLADLVRTDRHNHREVAGDSDEAAAVRILARAHQQLVWDRTRQTNRLRNALREYFPGALQAFPSLAHGDAVGVLATAPGPREAARLTISQMQLTDGLRVGYSGDFQWPLEKVTTVDALVVDSTCGSPGSVRRYTQGECDERLAVLLQRLLSTGPVVLKAHRGTLQRGLQVISGEIGCPVMANAMLVKEAKVYRDFGYSIGQVYDQSSQEAHQIRAGGRYIAAYGRWESPPVDMSDRPKVTLSSFFTKPDEPVTEYSERSFAVAMSDHADFDGTLEYVAATGAQFVMTDNTRSGKGHELATAIRQRLGVEARPSTGVGDGRWGGERVPTPYSCGPRMEAFRSVRHEAHARGTAAARAPSVGWVVTAPWNEFLPESAFPACSGVRSPSSKPTRIGTTSSRLVYTASVDGNRLRDYNPDPASTYRAPPGR